MSEEIEFTGNWLEKLDLSAVPDLDDKHQECEFFFRILSAETDRNQFRWLVSAFLNSVYSYFETSALTAHFAFTHPVTAEPMEDPESLGILRKYVKFTQSKKNPNYVKTGAVHPVVEEVYELRKMSTHHFSHSIMSVGPVLPRDFHFGDMRGEGKPALEQCQRAIEVVREVQGRLSS